MALPKHGSTPRSMAFLFDSMEPEMKGWYDGLALEHQQLMDFGQSYGDFDPYGKLAYLDQLDQISERWDNLFGRCSLMGLVNPRYLEQSQDFLSTHSIDEAGYRELISKTHDNMRQEAKNEIQSWS
mmetsp:Transcript_4846/g.8412  ORF Transcript_4846/g.8412 Transcript_4846/m.8412 type:complete len:126 (-) Transcript_4846:130-507(-)